jgi:hypothetical protein
MLRLLISCLAALLFGSCLDCHEEVWLSPDASGKAKVKMIMPLQAAGIHGGENGIRSLITDYLNATPAITSHSVETAVIEGRLKIDITMTFDNALDLVDLTSGSGSEKLPAAAAALIGHANMEFRGANVALQRRIDLTRSIPGSMFIPSDQLRGRNLTTIIHLPRAATSHNADTIGDSGKTLIWTTPLASALRNPVNQSFIMPLPIPWLMICGGILAPILLITGFFYYIYRRKRTKRMAAARS